MARLSASGGNHILILGKKNFKAVQLFQEKITEQEAAALFILRVVKEAQDIWPSTHKWLKDNFKEKFIIVVEDMVANFDLALAAIALDLQAVKNLFPEDQTERIKKWIFECIRTEDWGEYAISEIKKYDDVFQKALNNPEQWGNPIDVISVALLYKWLGDGIRSFEVKIPSVAGEQVKTGVVSPLLVMMVSGTLVKFAGFWKKMKENFELFEGDLPLNENERKL